VGNKKTLVGTKCLKICASVLIRARCAFLINGDQFNMKINKRHSVVAGGIISVALATSVWAEEAHFAEGILTIPQVNVDFEPGSFVNVQFKLAADGRWDLINATPETKPIIPEWLKALIDELSAAPVANPPAQIIQYTYNKATVYYLTPRCCDIMSVLYDVDGNILCHPDGGITGSGDGQCADFPDTKTDEVVIWRDDR